MSNHKPTYDDLEQENQQLKAKLQAQQTAAKNAKRKSLRFVSSFAQRFILGTQLTKELKNIKNKVFSGKIPTSDDWIDVSGAVFYRLTRIGMITILLALLPTLMLVIQSIQLRNQNTLFKAQNERINQQTYLQEADRRSSLVFLFSNVMDAIDRELRDDYNDDKIRNLSPQLIGRIISLSQRLKPYQYLEGDNLIEEPLSPERGQLLVNLVESRLDTVTYQKLWAKANFEQADLIDAHFDSTSYLVKVNLSFADLSFADLIDADLRGADLRGVDLIDADLIDADLSGADLIDADLSGADLSFADLIDADLSYADLSGAGLSGADLIDADLSGADLSFADLSGADLSGAIVNTNFLKNENIRGIENLRKKYKERPLTKEEAKYYRNPKNLRILKPINPNSNE